MDTRPEREGWVATHPKGQIQTSKDKNNSTDGYYVQVVKLMKFWRDRLPTTSCQLKSYILESLIFYGSIAYPSSHAVAVVNVLEGIEGSYGWYRDLARCRRFLYPAYPSVNVAKHWEVEDFKDFMNQVNSAAGTARKALDNADESESRKLRCHLRATVRWLTMEKNTKPTGPSKPPEGSLLSPEAMGGITASKGFGFQTRYAVCQLPVWLLNPAFLQLFHEGTGDIDLRFQEGERSSRMHYR